MMTQNTAVFYYPFLYLTNVCHCAAAGSCC